MTAPVAPDQFGLRPGRLWSLWDMALNFQLFGLCTLIRQLVNEENEMAGRVGVHDLVGDAPPLTGGMLTNALGGQSSAFNAKMPFLITDQDRDRMTNWLNYTDMAIAKPLVLSAAIHRVALFLKKLKHPMKGADFVAEVRALREAIEG